MNRRLAMLLLFAASALSCPVVAQASPQSPQQKKEPPQLSDPIPRSDGDQQSTPDVGDNESSSKQTQIDISPPRDDSAAHPGSDISDVTEFHTWNPHKAEKNIEVGEFYQKRRNYRAAEGRFREALEYKPGDAIATYRLAEVLDAQGQDAEAIKDYQEYLKIPSSGRFAPEAKKALERLEQKKK